MSYQSISYKYYQNVASQQLMTLLATKGVVANAIDADNLVFYSSGVLTPDKFKCKQINHAVSQTKKFFFPNPIKISISLLFFRQISLAMSQMDPMLHIGYVNIFEILILLKKFFKKKFISIFVSYRK